VTIKNIKTGNKNEVSIGWTENGTATQWEIRYRRYDVPGATYTYIMATSNPTTIQDIPLGFVYEFNVRSIGKGELKSGWSETQYAIVDLPYWTDIVTEQPSGYTEDTDGNVTISTTEGLAWLAVKVGGLNGQYYNTFEDKTVTLTADINLEGYRWYPIGGMNMEYSQACLMAKDIPCQIFILMIQTLIKACSDMCVMAVSKMSTY
jgi:hypothetical protein